MTVKIFAAQIDFVAHCNPRHSRIMPVFAARYLTPVIFNEPFEFINPSNYTDLNCGISFPTRNECRDTFEFETDFADRIYIHPSISVDADNRLILGNKIELKNPYFRTIKCFKAYIQVAGKLLPGERIDTLVENVYINQMSKISGET